MILWILRGADEREIAINPVEVDPESGALSRRLLSWLALCGK